MRRAWWLVVLVPLLLGARCVPVDRSEPVAGLSTAGYAGLVAGEDWHYVGASGEPAFENGWVNSAGLGYPKVAFRIREAGVVDIFGVAGSGTPGSTIFTLPASYRPSPSTATLPIIGSLAGGDYVPAFLLVFSDGRVRAYASPTSPSAVWLIGGFFLDLPDVAS